MLETEGLVEITRMQTQTAEPFRVVVVGWGVPIAGEMGNHSITSKQKRTYEINMFDPLNTHLQIPPFLASYR